MRGNGPIILSALANLVAFELYHRIILPEGSGSGIL